MLAKDIRYTIYAKEEAIHIRYYRYTDIHRVRIAKIHIYIPPRPSAPTNMAPMYLPIAYSAYTQAAVFAEIKNMLIFLHMYTHAPAPRYTKPGPGWWRSLKHTNSTYGGLYR